MQGWTVGKGHAGRGAGQRVGDMWAQGRERGERKGKPLYRMVKIDSQPPFLSSIFILAASVPMIFLSLFLSFVLLGFPFPGVRRRSENPVTREK